MKNKNLLQSFLNAISGIIYTIKSERNMKIHLAAAFFAVILSVLLKISVPEFLIVCLTVSAVIICELFNTAVEMIINQIFTTYNETAKTIKDIAAGAVFISAVTSLIVAYFVFFKRIGNFLFM